MNIINQFARKLFVGTMALALVVLATTASAGTVPQFVTVVKVVGSARYSTDGRSWQALNKGDVLKPGAVIQTAEKSTVDILMGEKEEVILTSPVSTGAPSAGSGGANSGPKANVVRIFPSSVLAIDKLIVERTGVDEVSETQLDLRAGKIMGNVKKLSSASRYEVKIPNGVAGIRGTTYIVTASGQVFVLEGQVIISYVGSDGILRTKTVSAGQMFDPYKDNNGNPTTTIGDGFIGPITPDQQNDINQNGPLGELPHNTVPGYYPADNKTVIHVSPN